MVYRLTYHQEKKFWSFFYKNFNLAQDTPRIFKLRLEYWNTFIEPTYHIQYNLIELNSGYSHNILEGHDKHINWFLLKHDLL